MKEKLRRSGIDIIGDVPWGTHICLFYHTKEDLMEILVTYFKAGLENNEFCLWVTSKPVGVEDAKESLRKAIPDFKTYMGKGQIEIIPYTDWFTTGGVFDSKKVSNNRFEKLNRALNRGYNGMRLSGNTTWLEKENWNDFIEFKEETDKAMDSYKMINLCTYSLDRHNAVEIIDVVLNHQFALIKKDGKWKRIESSKRKRIEEALSEGEERLRFALETSRIGAWDLDLVDHTAYRSIEHDRIFGYEQLLPQWTYEMFLDHVLPEDRAMVDAKFRKAITMYSNWNFECRIRRVDGEVRWIWAVGRHSIDTTGSGRCIAGIVQDITERKKSEQALKKVHETLEEKVKERTAELEKAYNLLKENERSLAEAQKMAHIGSWDNNLATGELHWSDEMYRIFGHNPQEHMTYDKFLSYIHPDDIDYVYNSIKEAFNGNVYATEHRIVRPDGEERIVHSEREVTFNERNNPVRMKGTVQDITESKKAEEKLRESEEKYRNIVETADEGIGIIDNEFKLTFVNKKLEDMLGYNTEEFIAKSIWDFLSEESKRIINSILDRELQEFENPELKFIRKDGSSLWAQVNAKPIFDSDGKFMGVTTMLSDVTKRKEAEKALANIGIARQKEIHHRIKNNLQVISSLLDLQAEKFSNREFIENSEVLEAFRESQNRVMSISLIHEELYEGKETDKLDFSLYLQRLVENFFKIYRLGNIDIVLKMDIEKNVFFNMDIAVPLGMIVNELLSNSFKYAFSGRKTGEIQIKLLSKEAKDKENDKDVLTDKSTRYTLIVSDNGIGIPEDINFENPETLGLQLVNILVDQLNGKIKFERDEGTEFTICFIT